MTLLRVFVLLIAAHAAFGQKFYAYIGNLASDSALLAWGTTDGANTIGRSSPSHGDAVIRMAGQTITSRKNWVVVGGLKPDTDYPYQITLNEKTIGQGSVHTWPTQATRLVFFVLGDYGTGNRNQAGVAQAMAREFEKRQNSGNPVRFVLTLGDNIYGDITNVFLGVRHTGASDSDWTNKFFEPYRPILAHIPFYPTLGNHDGNETEKREDLSAYLDNFFFPNDKPARWYTFDYGGLADFFGLDTTMNSESGPPRPIYFQNEPEFRWMQEVIPASRAPWKIPYFHHPPFNAGPRHPASYRDLKHWVDLFARSGVKVSFAGHEHNFQYSEVNAESEGIRFVVSGSGGELRTGSIQSKLAKANIAGWAPQNHFLVVEIDGKTMRITPIGYEPIDVRDVRGAPAQMPIAVTLP